MIPSQKSLTQSQCSESATSASTAKAAFMKMSGGISSIFPMFDQLTQTVPLPGILYHIAFLYFCIQVLTTSLWLQRSNVWTPNGLDKQIVRYCQYISLWTTDDKSGDVYYTVLIAAAVMFFLSAGFFVFQMVTFANRRRFYHWTLYPTRFCIEIIPLVILHPIGHLIGRFLLRTVRETTTVDVVCFVVSVILFVLCLIIFWTTTSLIASSAYMPLTPWVSLTGNPIVLIVGVNSLFVFASVFSVNYPSWLMHFIVTFHLGFMIFQVAMFSELPYIKAGSNYLMMTTLLTSCLMDITRLVCLLLTPNSTAVLISYLVFIILSLVFSIVYRNLWNRRIKKQLTFVNPHNEEEDADDNYEPSDDEKTERLVQLKCDISARLAKRYITYAIAHHLPTFGDFSHVKFVMQHHHSSDMLLFCLRVVAFFPPAYRLMNLLFGEAVKCRGVSFSQTFFLYQLNRIKVLRQSSASAAASERLQALKQASGDVQLQVRGFWGKKTCKESTILKMHGAVTKTKALWEEALRDFPNNASYCEQYSTFLIESATDFIEAIRQHHRADLIETGYNFSVDLCFRQFVRTFPSYLKAKVVDVKGNFLKQQKSRKGSSASSDKNQLSSISSMSELDVAMEEGIGKSILSHARMRLALQRAVKERQSKSIKCLQMISWILFLLSLAVFTITFVYFFDYFGVRTEIAERVEQSVKSRMFFFASTVSLFYHWGNEVGVIDTKEVEDAILPTDVTDADFLGKGQTWVDRTINFNVLSRDMINLFMENIAAISLTGTDVYSLTGVLLNEVVDMQLCNASTPMEPRKANLKKLLVVSYMIQSVLAGSGGFEEWFNNSVDWCNLMTMAPAIRSSFMTLRVALSQENVQERRKTRSIVLYFMIVMPVGLFVIGVVMYTIACILVLREMRRFTKLLLDFDHSVKVETAQSIKRDGDEIDPSTLQSDSSGGFSVVLVFNIVICVFFVIIAIVVFLQCYECSAISEELGYVTTWLSESSRRRALALEGALYSSIAIVLSGREYTTEFTTARKTMDVALEVAAQMEEASMLLMEDTDDNPPLAGHDDELDALNQESQCEIDPTRSTVHEMYRCGSASQLVNIYSSMVHEMSVRRRQYGGRIEAEVPAQFLHLVSVHLVPLLEGIDARLMEIMKRWTSDFDTQHTIFYVVEILLALIMFIVMQVCVSIMKTIYQMLLGLMRRISPISLVANNKFMEYFMDRTSSQGSSAMTTSKSIIHHSADGVLIIGSSGVIEFINQSVSRILGFTPEQLLGQPVSTIFSEEDKGKVDQQMSLMRNKQGGLTFEDHFICISDDDTPVPCFVTILAMVNSHESVPSLVLVLRDETELRVQQENAENAKKQSETLLYQILPRDIVIRLNQGEKDISFSVPSATIMFIDIVKFSEYAQSLTPQQIMGNLSLLFGGFDEVIQKYPLLLKIKLIGDVYMCAGGLFNHDDPPVTHAEEMIRFALDCLQVLEDTNLKLNAILSVRIGINTGGPLIAGVLGSDKPVFDIIGDPINIASRLQSTDIAGSIQISQSTYDLVSGLDFIIEPRGEVFLKGKGKTLSYLVRPVKNFGFQMSSYESMLSTSKDSAEH